MAEKTLVTLPRHATPDVAAELLGVEIQTLTKWRCLRMGPPYVKLSPRCIRYPLDKLAAWMDERAVTPTDGEAR